MNAAPTTEATPQWQLDIAAQLEQLGLPEDTSHLVVHVPDEGEAVLLDLCDSENAGVISAEDHATKVDGGEVKVVPAGQIVPLIGAIYEVGADGEIVQTDGTQQQPALEPDAEKGKLFDLPRVKVAVDESDPSLLKVSFSGGVKIERGSEEWVEFYNGLRVGKTAEIRVGVFIAGAPKTHRRSKEGDVDAIVETKSIVVTDIFLDA